MEAIVVAVAKAKSEKDRLVTSKDLVHAVAEQHQLTTMQGLQMLDDLVDLITQHLRNGERVKIKGLGILHVRERAARIGRNPATGAPLQIKAGKKVAFRATKHLRMVI
jgi:DNA-binding protein HU-beta